MATLIIVTKVLLAWVKSGVKAVFKGISIIVLLVAGALTFLNNLVRATIERLQYLAEQSGLTPTYFVEFFEDARMALQTIVELVEQVQGVFPVATILGIIGAAIAVKMSIRLTRWILAFIPMMAAG